MQIIKLRKTNYVKREGSVPFYKNNMIFYPFTKPESELVMQGTLQRRKMPKKCPPPTLPKPVIKKETPEQLPGCQGLTNNL